MLNFNIMNTILETILRKMCEFGGYSFEIINWTDNSHLKLRYKNENSEEEFINGFVNIYIHLKFQN